MLIGVPLSPQGIIAQERHIQLENSSVSAFLFQKVVLAGPGQPAPRWCADCLSMLCCLSPEYHGEFHNLSTFQYGVLYCLRINEREHEHHFILLLCTADKTAK